MVVSRYIFRGTDSVSQSPTLVVLHGTGGDEQDLLPLVGQIGWKGNILSLRGSVSEGGMNRFFKRLSVGVLDEQDLIGKTYELSDFLSEVSTKEGFDKNNMVALGYSNGANMIASILILQPGLFQGAVMYRPMKPYIDIESFVVPAPIPVMITSGTSDPIISLSSTVSLVNVLMKAGYNVQFHKLPTQHGLTADDVKYTREWMSDLKF